MATAAEMIMMIETSLGRGADATVSQNLSTASSVSACTLLFGFRPWQDHVARVGLINGDSTNATRLGWGHLSQIA